MASCSACARAAALRAACDLKEIDEYAVAARADLVPVRRRRLADHRAPRRPRTGSSWPRQIARGRWPTPRSRSRTSGSTDHHGVDPGRSPARRVRERRRGRGRRGRLHDHPAAGEEPVRRQRRDAPAQARRGIARLAARGSPHEGPDPHEVPEHGVLRQGAYGVQAAAQTYFSIDASDLALPQSALLAGADPGAEPLRPVRAPGGAYGRRNVVLG